MKQKLKRGWSRKRILGIALVCLFPSILVATLIGVLHQRQSSAIAVIQAEQDRVRGELEATGDPFTWEAWETAQPDFTEEENGAPYILEAIALLKSAPLEHDALLPYVARLETPAAHEAYTGESLHAMGAFVATNQPAIDAFLKGVAQPHIEFPVPEAEEDEEAVEEKRALFDVQVTEMRKTVRVATDHALSTGENELLWRLIGGQASAYGLYHDGSPYRFMTVRDLCDTIERTLNSHELSNAEIALLIDSLEPSDPVAWFRAALVGDADPRTMIPNPRDYLILVPIRNIAARSPLPDSTIKRIAGRDYEAAKLRTLENVRDAYHLCEKTWKEAAPAIEQGQEAEDTLGKGLSYEMRPYFGMVWHFHTRAQLQLTRIALSLEAFRVRHGQLPDLLNALVESDPTLNITDPFDGAPIRYVIQEAGFLLYSVGENLADDGGATYRKRRAQESEGDIVFEVRR